MVKAAKTKKKLTIRDIARECGVSASTVSRVLNNEPGISRETTVRVFEVARANDFSLTKRRKPISRSHVNLVVVVPDRSEIELNPFFEMGELINAVNSAFKNDKYSIEIQTFSDLKIFDGGKAALYDGVILAFGDIGGEGRSLLRSKNIPFIFLNRTFETENYVSCNNYKGMLKLREYLNGGSFEKIGYLGCGTIPVNRDRLRGYITGSLEATGAVDDRIILEVASINEVDAGTARFFLDRGCDAVICFNDNFAIRMITELSGMGVSVPDEVSITGFDNSPARRVFRPLITTISLSTFELCFFASRWLRDNILHRETRELRLEVEGTLLEGETVLLKG
ncbi:MAG: LacI family DNA-binding transcriptional regulator [Deltaproteobacteria bacterium]|uniref:LacI family DNA-binding transcriptional regulator n=1 Tax=Candidatus Zymogenus saltonus TaxID=2844893 RepID=A0A9D8KDN6_9DELT|nr:LacI family DNA-binding transcriptional regulator [Candidatus Zymogenus saltonus]